MDKITLDTVASCACGSVTVTVRGRVLSMLLCTCRDCRKATGTGHSTITLLHRDSVSIAGDVKGFSRTANSGATITRHFCPACGTPIFAITTRAPDVVLVPAGLFDEPDWFKPRQAIFARSHLDWDILPDGLPLYETYRPEGGM